MHQVNEFDTLWNIVIEFRHLRHALALARFRNSARTAEALHLTQPSLTRGIATLEAALGAGCSTGTRRGSSRPDGD
jgi:hypothetical protein